MEKQQLTSAGWGLECLAAGESAQLSEQQTFDRLVIHLPHAATTGLDWPVFSGWPQDEGFRRLVNHWTDVATDRLFGLPTATELAENEQLAALQPHLRAVQFPLSRFVADVERLPDDPLEREGQGVVYRHYEGYERQVSALQDAMLRQLHACHLEQVRQQLAPHCLLVDCHSFPAELSDVDICIGVNDDWSRPSDAALQAVVRHFRRAGYSVGINTPYANALSPLAPFPYVSLMIELNKRIYLRTDTEPDAKRCQSLRRLILGLYQQLTGMGDSGIS